MRIAALNGRRKDSNKQEVVANYFVGMRIKAADAAWR